jgi:hypothetical protein
MIKIEVVAKDFDCPVRLPIKELTRLLCGIFFQYHSVASVPSSNNSFLLILQFFFSSHSSFILRFNSHATLLC